MAQVSEASLVRYEFSEAEAPLAYVFTDLQEKHIKTEIAIIVEEKMKLAVPVSDPNATQRFLQEHEYLRGKIEILTYLLVVSEQQKIEAVERLRDQIESQNQE